MKNIELKVYLKDRKKMAAAVKKIGAKFQGDLFQVDTYYRVKTGRLKTREINGREFKLVYYTRPDLKRRKVSDYEIIEFKKDQFAKVKDLFRILFGELVVVVKKRSLWIYKDTRIHLDQVKRLGSFLELETVVTGSLRRAKREYDEVYKILHLSRFKAYQRSYSDMMLETHKKTKHK